MSDVIRVFTEKRDGYNVEAKQMLWDLRHNLGMKSIQKLRFANRYDISGLSREEFEKAKDIIFSEPNADVVYEEQLQVEDGWQVFAM